MLRNFVRGFENALSADMCKSLIDWFESNPDVKTIEVNRDTRNDKQMWLPKTSQMIVFPAWIKHEVPAHTCEHDRIMISGNLNMDKPEEKISS